MVKASRQQTVHASRNGNDNLFIMLTTPQSIWYSLQRQIRVLSIAFILALLPSVFAFQSEHPLSGRRIAPVMGFGGADWLDRNERESEENPDAALDALNLKPGMVVGDVG